MLTLWARALGMTAICLSILGTGLAATDTDVLCDAELKTIYAAGFDVKIDFDISLAVSDPSSLVVTGNAANALQEFANASYRQLASTPAYSRLGSGFDADGTYMPNLQQLTTNNLTIRDNALQNAQTLLNIFALNGDVAVGMNLNVIVNPTVSDLTITQTNINWSNLTVLGTPITPGSLGIQ